MVYINEGPGTEGKLKMREGRRTLDNGVHGACLLTETTIDALSHVYVCGTHDRTPTRISARTREEERKDADRIEWFAVNHPDALRSR